MAQLRQGIANQIQENSEIEELYRDPDTTYITFTIFDGMTGELQPWILWLEDFFIRNDFNDDDEKLNLAQATMEDEVRVWLNWRQSLRIFESWDEMKEDLFLRFGNENDLARIRLIRENERLVQKFCSTEAKLISRADYCQEKVPMEEVLLVKCGDDDDQEGDKIESTESVHDVDSKAMASMMSDSIQEEESFYVREPDSESIQAKEVQFSLLESDSKTIASIMSDAIHEVPISDLDQNRRVNRLEFQGIEMVVTNQNGQGMEDTYSLVEETWLCTAESKNVDYGILAVGKLNGVAYKVFHRMLFRKKRLQQLSKGTLYPKSWQFKSKGRRLNSDMPHIGHHTFFIRRSWKKKSETLHEISRLTAEAVLTGCIVDLAKAAFIDWSAFKRRSLARYGTIQSLSPSKKILKTDLLSSNEDTHETEMNQAKKMMIRAVLIHKNGLQAATLQEVMKYRLVLDFPTGGIIEDKCDVMKQTIRVLDLLVVRHQENMLQVPQLQKKKYRTRMRDNLFSTWHRWRVKDFYDGCIIEFQSDDGLKKLTAAAIRAQSSQYSSLELNGLNMVFEECVHDLTSSGELHTKVQGQVVFPVEMENFADEFELVYVALRVQAQCLKGDNCVLPHVPPVELLMTQFLFDHEKFQVKHKWNSKTLGILCIEISFHVAGHGNSVCKATNLQLFHCLT